MSTQRLNPAQQQAVDQIDGPVLILAGAGTGKTRVITSRIAHMIQRRIAPENILAVTFTNKAANEMRERVAKMVARSAAAELTVCTFHSLCVRILRRSIERLGYKRNFSIYTESDQLGLVRRLVVKKAGRDEKLDPKLALALIGQAKNRGIPVSGDSDSLVAEVYRAYQAELKTLNAVDFDDLLILAVRVLQEHEDVRGECRKKFRYLMVDEFQDTNRLQIELLRQLTGPERNVCVVGDDDQSIYGWRGAEIANILEFERHFADPLVVKLEQNYRSTNPILHTANSLIRHNRNRRSKNLWSRNPGEDRVRLIAMPGEEEEAGLIVNEILELRATESRPWEDFAVLFRMNTQSRLFEESFRRHEIPYRLIGGQSFYDRREVKDLLAYLQVLVNPADDVNLLRVINSPPRGIGDGAVSLATGDSVARLRSVFDSLQAGDFTSQLSNRARAAVDAFVDMIAELREKVLAPHAGYPELVDRLVSDIGYVEWVKRGCKTPEEGATREQNIRELIDALHQHRARSSGGLRGFLDEVLLMRDREEGEEEDLEKKRGVTLITLHASKGLEFPRVYLVGLEEGILPHSRSVAEGARDEERRLLYVGMTRARTHLTMTYCASRKRWGDLVPCQPSSFFAELDREQLDELSFEELSRAPATEDLAASYFRMMKDRIGGAEKN